MNDPEAITLYRAWKESDSVDDLNRLISKLEGMAIHIANSHRNLPYEWEDRKAIAMSGIWEAILKFDDTRPGSFTNYVYTWAKGRLYNEVRDHGHMIRLPRSLWVTLRDMNRSGLLYECVDGRNPDTLPSDKHRAALDWFLNTQHMVSADMAIALTGSDSWGTVKFKEISGAWVSLSSCSDGVPEDGLIWLDIADMLTDHELESFVECVVNGKPQSEVARKMGYAQMSVSRWMNKAKQKVAEYLLEVA